MLIRPEEAHQVLHVQYFYRPYNTNTEAAGCAIGPSLTSNILKLYDRVLRATLGAGEPVNLLFAFRCGDEAVLW